MKYSPKIFRLLLALMAIALPSLSYAHRPSDSFARLNVDESGVGVVWEISLRDLESLVGIDKNVDNKISWGEMLAAKTQIQAEALGKFLITVDRTPCAPDDVTLKASRDYDRGYAVLEYRCFDGDPAKIALDYQFLFDRDSQHRGIVEIKTPEISQTMIFSDSKRAREIVLRELSTFQQFSDFVEEGVWHIWVGFDHMLFLFALLLPAVLRRRHNRWLAVDRFSESFWDVLKVVTSFTVAHSITLIAVTVGAVSLPSRIVETVIAVSVAVVALNNIFPKIRGQDRWTIAFLFGLIHGFGFASVLADLELSSTGLVAGLLGFNVGVEVGQIVMVAIALPVLYIWRHFTFYIPGVLKGGSFIILLVSLGWCADRIFDLGLMPF